MDRIGQITLITSGEGKDDYGIRKPAEEKADVFCQIGSVSAAEISQASQNSIRPSLMAVVYTAEYHGQKLVEYEGRRYAVYRTYVQRKNGDRTELYLEERVGR